MTPHNPSLDERGSFCEPCGKYESEHGTCAKCGHLEPCDCICEFLRTEWPTHHANPERVDVS